MNKKVGRSVQWARIAHDTIDAVERMTRPFRPEVPMNESPYQTIKRFELMSDRTTKVVTSVSARSVGDKRSFRVSTVREHMTGGLIRRSPWLGLRELALKSELEKAAIEFIAAESAKHSSAEVTFQA